MLDLDAALTNNHPPEGLIRQIHHYPKTIEKWIFNDEGGIWYLSDSGYSRVGFDMESGRLFLTYNSTSRVRARWEQAAPQRQKVEELVRQWLVDNGWSSPFKESAADQIVDKLLEWGGLFTSWNGYWMDAKGILHKVDDHISWAKRNVLSRKPQTAGLSDSGVYAEMSNLGWLKVVIERSQIFIDPTRATRLQKTVLEEHAIDNRLKIVDSLTQRIIFNPREWEAED